MDLAVNTVILSTELKSSTNKIVWEIDNFSACLQQYGPGFESPKFECHGPNRDKQKWIIKIYPNVTNDGLVYVSISITLAECENIQVMAKITSSIQNANREETQIKRLDIGRYQTGSYSLGWSVKRDFLFAEENGLLPNDRLTIICQLDIFGKMESVVRSGNIHIPRHNLKLSEDIANLWEKKIHADCVLVASDGNEIAAHKNILACRLPVFAAMFKDGTAEANSGRIEIADIPGDVLQQMLHFVYTGVAPNLGEGMAKELLAAADKYQVEELKLLCEQYLADSLDIANASELLILADFRSANQLKSQAIQFIRAHAHEVIKSNGWKVLSEERPHLIVPIFEAVVQQKRKRKLV